MSKFRVGSFVIATGGYNVQSKETVKFVRDEQYEVMSETSPAGLITVKTPSGVVGERFETWFAAAPDKAAPLTKSARLILAKEAELARLKEAAANRARATAERKAKAERAKALAGLSAAGKRVVAMLRANPDAFGCQVGYAIDLASAITGDKAEAVRKAMTK